VSAVAHAPASPLRTARALWDLARPKGGAALMLVPLVGYGFAHWDYALDLVRPGAMLLVLASWFVASAGTMWLNAALDGDEDGALFAVGTHRPEGLARFGYAALAVGVALSAATGTHALVPCALCAVLAILYSHPRTTWKAHPILGPAVNAAGYGVLSPLAGWLVVGKPLTFRAVVVHLVIGVWILGATFAAQAFQQKDDARRGYRTLVVTHGPAACLRATRASFYFSVGALAVLAAAGYLPRLLLAGLPIFALADRWLAAWRRQPGGGDPSWAAGFLIRVLVGGCVLVLLSCADFALDAAAERPAAGLATARGRPLE
jgi:4-hydroxybenzoate polyprenyltransferase